MNIIYLLLTFNFFAIAINFEKKEKTVIVLEGDFENQLIKIFKGNLLIKKKKIRKVEKNHCGEFSYIHLKNKVDSFTVVIDTNTFLIVNRKPVIFIRRDLMEHTYKIDFYDKMPKCR